MILILLFLFGLVFGSFISALTWRYPKGISIKKGRSICPNCRNQIAWFDNIPLLSFLILMGKCRNCKKPISRRYPAIELSTAIGFIIIGYFATTVQDLVLYVVYSILILCILEIIFIIDLEHQVIPDSFVFVGILIITAYYFLVPSAHAGSASSAYSLFSSLFAGFIAATLLLLIHLFTRGRGMGLGDVKFAVLGGLLVGPRLFLIWLFLAFLTGAFVGTILILGRKAYLKSKIAFGPFLVLAIPLALLYGEKILFWIHAY